MAKIVMPKNSALLEEVEAVLKIYYEFIFAIIFFLLGSTMYTVKLYTCMRKIRNLLIKNKQN